LFWLMIHCVLSRSRALSSASHYRTPFVVATDPTSRSLRRAAGNRLHRDHPVDARGMRTTTTMTPSSRKCVDVIGAGIDQQALANVLAMRLVLGGSSTDGGTNAPPPDYDYDKNDDGGGGIRACIAVAGGGSCATSSILSVPGASSVLLESVVVYDRLSFAEYVSGSAIRDLGRWEGGMTSPPPPPADADASFDVPDDGGDGDGECTTDASDGGIVGDDDDNDALVGSNELPSSSSSSSSYPSSAPFKFCSIEAAMLLSKAALHRSLHLSPSVNDRILRCTGVGCTSSLVADVPGSSSGRRRRGRRSRAYVACSTPADGTFVWEMILDDDDDDGGGGGTDDGGGMIAAGGGDATRPRRSRMEEERVVSNAVLLAMLRCRERRRYRATSREGIENDGYDIVDDGDDGIASLLRGILDRDGDVITERTMDHTGVVSASVSDGADMRFGGTGKVDVGKSVAWGASRIIDGKANAVAILPVVVRTGPTTRAIRMEALLADDDIPLPHDVLIVPGSFNPPHAGHVGLANAAVAALRRLRRWEMNGGSGVASSGGRRFRAPSPPSPPSTSIPTSILRSMWDTVGEHIEGQYDPPVLFEMSVTNADKPPLDPTEVERRVDLFASLSFLSSEMPKDWGVILTNAPLFSHKTGVLNSLLLANNDDTARGDDPVSHSEIWHLTRGRHRRKMSFVVGTDTLLRIIDPKYYGNNLGGMISALLCMKDRGVHFIVGGRLEQGTKNRYVFLSPDCRRYL
jgi:hypothetical protein